MTLSFKKGDVVTLLGMESAGEILTVKGENAEVDFNGMIMKVKTSKLTFANPINLSSHNEVKEKSELIDTKSKLMNFRFELDVKGLMKDEALELINQQMDDAILLGINEFVIVHGRSGQLKPFVRSELKKYQQVKSISDANPERGGENATVVRL